MLGKPKWFREKRFGWGLVPISLQGWIYTLVWSGVVGGPFALLVSLQLPVEALIWLLAAISLLVWDVQQILRAKRVIPDDVLYIGDDENTTVQRRRGRRCHWV